MSRSARYGSLEAALLRHETYATGQKRLILAVMVMAVLCAICVLAATFTVMSKPEPRYFATRAEGGILPLTPVSQPILTDSQLLNFAVHAVTRSMTLDFSNYRQDLADSQIFFEQPSGWENYLRALESSTMLKFIINRKLVSSAVAENAAIIKKGPDERGRHSWTVQIQLNVTYQSSSEKTSSPLRAEVVVVRVPTYEAPDAVAISRIVVQSGRMTAS
jgi:intracellular multiplication protein IcmL